MKENEVNIQLCMDTAVLAGEILMESNAEAYRVEETMVHILKKAGYETADAFSTSTGLFLSIDSTGKDPITAMRSVPHPATNLGNIIKVNTISRNIVSDEITMEEAFQQLLAIQGKEYPQWALDLGNLVLVQGFVLLLGGTWLDFGLTFLVSLFVILTSKFCKAKKLPKDVKILSITSGVAFISSALSAVWGSSIHDSIVVAAMIPLFPGIALITGLRDAFKDDYAAGSAKVLEALITAVLISIGTIGGLMLGSAVFSR